MRKLITLGLVVVASFTLTAASCDHTAAMHWGMTGFVFATADALADYGFWK